MPSEWAVSAWFNVVPSRAIDVSDGVGSNILINSSQHHFLQSRSCSPANHTLNKCLLLMRANNLTISLVSAKVCANHWKYIYSCNSIMKYVILFSMRNLNNNKQTIPYLKLAIPLAQNPHYLVQVLDLG